MQAKISGFREVDTSIQFIKKSLWKGYQENMKNESKIISLLNKQGKKTLMRHINNKYITLEDAINSDSYFLTELDIWGSFYRIKYSYGYIYYRTLKRIIMDLYIVFYAFTYFTFICI